MEAQFIGGPLCGGIDPEPMPHTQGMVLVHGNMHDHYYRISLQRKKRHGKEDKFRIRYIYLGTESQLPSEGSESGEATF